MTCPQLPVYQAAPSNLPRGVICRVRTHLAVMFLADSVHAVSSPDYISSLLLPKFHPFFEAQLQPNLNLPLIILSKAISSSGFGTK